jgi:N-methylhydantoinase A
MGIRVGIDTGGTFTDLIGVDEDTNRMTVAKRPSTPRNPEQGVFDSLASPGIDVDDITFLILGSTIGINALHQRTGARVIYLTTKGFEDVPFIQRINRRHHYDLDWVKPAPLAERRDCIGVNERITRDERVLVPLKDEELARIRDVVAERIAESPGPTAIAVNLLFAYANPAHELKIGEFLRREFPDAPVSLSHRVAPIWREYERGTTTLADAYIKPLVTSFAGNLDAGFRERGLKCKWQFMKSNGGNMVAEAASEQAVQLLLSGLAGGIIAGRYFGELAGSNRVVTLDMGGTSTDVGIVIDGEYGYTTEYQVEWGVPIAAPFIDITTIGAGGGSIAWIDKGGFLKVGPQSAGAEPGPACYDAGGTAATVTDANLVLGRLNPDYFLGGRMKLNADRAIEAVARTGERVGMGAEEAALSIVQLANENMANAIRLITVERGIDPREFDLVAFGGAGPLHGAALAESVGTRRIIVPPNAGLASAFGTLVADLRVDRSWTHAYRSNNLDVAHIDERFNALTDSSLKALREEGFSGTPVIQRSISMRYMGQNYEQDVPVAAGAITESSLAEVFGRFHRQHDAFYGYSIPGEIMELVHFNVSVIGEVPKVTLPKLSSSPANGSGPGAYRRVYFEGAGFIDCPIYLREGLAAGAVIRGPAVIDDVDSTVLLPAERQLSVTDRGLLIIE